MKRKIAVLQKIKTLQAFLVDNTILNSSTLHSSCHAKRGRIQDSKIKIMKILNTK